MVTRVAAALLSVADRHIACYDSRLAMRGKGVSAAVRRLPAGMGALTVSRSALRGAGDEQDRRPFATRKQVRSWGRSESWPSARAAAA
jgi:hypothetical protein